MHKREEKLLEVLLALLHHVVHPVPDDQYKLSSLLWFLLCLILTYSFCFRPSTVLCSNYRMSSAVDPIYLFAVPLLLFLSCLSACTPDASGLSAGSSSLNFQFRN